MKENPKVSIIDYGIGNLFSVLKACEAVGLNPQITDNSKDKIKGIKGINYMWLMENVVNGRIII